MILCWAASQPSWAACGAGASGLDTLARAYRTDTVPNIGKLHISPYKMQQAHQCDMVQNKKLTVFLKEILMLMLLNFIEMDGGKWSALSKYISEILTSVF